MKLEKIIIYRNCHNILNLTISKNIAFCTLCKVDRKLCKVSMEDTSFEAQLFILHNNKEMTLVQTGTVLAEGLTTFKPIIDRMWELTGEFVPYLIGIAIAALWISLTWRVVKFILGYLRGKASKSVRGK